MSKGDAEKGKLSQDQLVSLLNSSPISKGDEITHKKTGQTYEVVSVVFDTATNDISVVYQAIGGASVNFVRPLIQVLDGRFDVKTCRTEVKEVDWRDIFAPFLLMFFGVVVCGLLLCLGGDLGFFG